MTYSEAILKTKDDKRKTKEQIHAKYWLMRRIYRRVCKKIDCHYCPVCKTCNLLYALNHGVSFRKAVLLNMRDEDIVTASKWSRGEAIT